MVRKLSSGKPDEVSTSARPRMSKKKLGSDADAGDEGRREQAQPDCSELAFEDPLSVLPATARRLLLAAKSVVVAGGFEALTLSAVAREAGENTALISYYFRNKAGLVAALLDSVIHDEYIASQNRMVEWVPSELAERLTVEMRALGEAREDFRVFFELLPHVVSDDVLRRRMSRLYTWYWSVKLEWLAVDHPTAALEDRDLRGLAQLLSAIVDGLAVQSAIDPDLDLTIPYSILSRLLEGTSLLALLEEARLRRESGAVW